MRNRLYIPFLITLLAALLCSQRTFSEEDKVQSPCVSGRFYPADKAELDKHVTAFLQQAKKISLPGKVRGLVSPHAGYIYSGQVAGSGYAHVDSHVKRVIILAPSHHVRFNGAAIADADVFRTPLGDVPVSPVVKKLLKLPGFAHVPVAYSQEHSLEVQIPFLQKALGKFELIPLVLGNVDPSALAEKLLAFVDENTLVVASSDLSHYYPYEQAKVLDKICIDAISQIDFSPMDKCEACGKDAVMVLMEIARIQGWQGVVVDAKSSGDTAGPKDRVVGYTSIAFVEPKGGMKKMNSGLVEKDKTALLRLARSVIRAKLEKGAQIEKEEGTSPSVLEKRGCFVTLQKNGQLRGCIGTIEPVHPLWEGVKANAINAAFQDPRFPPLTKEELDQVRIEVSVLTAPQSLPFKDGEELKAKLKPGIHGVILSRGWRRATFLPQVWDQLPNKETFLIHLCKKGGMTPNCWKDPETKVEVYEAEHFSE